MYWKQLKNGNLQVQDRRPKDKVSVSESSFSIEFQVYDHNLQLLDEQGMVLDTITIRTFCGYDRGPKKEQVIKGAIASRKFFHARAA